MTEVGGALGAVRRRLGTLSDIDAAVSLLQWDQQTQMPEAAGAGRAEQVATLSRIAHEHATDPELGRLLDAAADEVGLDPHGAHLADPAHPADPGEATEDQALVRVALRDFRRATRLPASLVEELARATSLAELAWAAARRASDWSRFAPHLERIIELTVRKAEAFGFDEHPLDPLIDHHEPGATRKRLAAVFEELRAALVPMVRAVAEVAETGDNRDAPLHGRFDEATQEAFGLSVIERFGYDFSAGRQDRAAHPFCTSLGPGDVRITTRFDPSFLSTALFSTLHEAGHGLYEQNISPAYARTPLGEGSSIGVHESQSRLWENLVGRSRPFWRRFYPELQAAFPEALSGVDGESFYRAINFAAPTPIRVEADELTYNLHVLLRFEIEADLLDGTLPVAELPSAWNERTEAMLGIVPEDDAEGVLQDVHWAFGAFGYFPTYTVGNVLASQLYETAVSARPEIPDEMERGEFGALREWLTEHVWRHGGRYDPDDLVIRATGRPMETGPYLAYLRTKFGELYDL